MPDPTPEELRSRLDAMLAGQVETRALIQAVSVEPNRKMDALANTDAILAGQLVAMNVKMDGIIGMAQKLQEDIDEVKEDVAPAKTYFEAQNAALANDAANKGKWLASLRSIDPKTVVQWATTIATAGLGGGFLSHYFSAPEQHMTTTITQVAPSHDTPSSEPSDLPGGDGE